MPTHPKIAHVLFDESHSEAWTIRPELAREMQPAHPADSSLTKAAAAIERFDFTTAPHTDGPLDAATLGAADVLVIAHPSDSRWEATTGTGAPAFGAPEVDAIERFVTGGGGLIVLGETENDKYGNNLNELLARFDIQIESTTVQDYEHHRNAPSWVLAELDAPEHPYPGADPLARVESACFYRSV